jgi:hypothetical protein
MNGIECIDSFIRWYNVLLHGGFYQLWAFIFLSFQCDQNYKYYDGCENYIIFPITIIYFYTIFFHILHFYEWRFQVLFLGIILWIYTILIQQYFTFLLRDFLFSFLPFLYYNSKIFKIYLWENIEENHFYKNAGGYSYPPKVVIWTLIYLKTIIFGDHNGENKRMVSQTKILVTQPRPNQPLLKVGLGNQTSI